VLSPKLHKSLSQCSSRVVFPSLSKFNWAGLASLISFGVALVGGQLAVPRQDSIRAQESLRLDVLNSIGGYFLLEMADTRYRGMLPMPCRGTAKVLRRPESLQPSSETSEAGSMEPTMKAGVKRPEPDILYFSLPALER
jgi:hypothetical protein